MTLDELNLHEKAIVTKIDDLSNMKQRLIDIGFVDGTNVECVLISPYKNPKAYMVKGAVIAIRNEDAKFIEVKRGKYGG